MLCQFSTASGLDVHGIGRHLDLAVPVDGLLVTPWAVSGHQLQVRPGFQGLRLLLGLLAVVIDVATSLVSDVECSYVRGYGIEGQTMDMGHWTAI